MPFITGEGSNAEAQKRTLIGCRYEVDYRLEMINEAEEQLGHPIREVPGLAPSHYLLAHIRERRARWAEAMAQYKKVLSLSRSLYQCRCAQCGDRSIRRENRCPPYGEWNSLTEVLRSLIRPPEPSTLRSTIRY